MALRHFQNRTSQISSPGAHNVVFAFGALGRGKAGPGGDALDKKPADALQQNFHDGLDKSLLVLAAVLSKQAGQRFLNRKAFGAVNAGLDSADCLRLGKVKKFSRLFFDGRFAGVFGKWFEH